MQVIEAIVYSAHAALLSLTRSIARHRPRHDAAFHATVADVAKGRELLRRFFRDGAITLVPKDGVYVATSEVLPLMLLTMPEQETTTPPRQSQEGGRFPQVGCAGALHALGHRVSLPFEVALISKPHPAALGIEPR
jgi:hypothetical protein